LSSNGGQTTVGGGKQGNRNEGRGAKRVFRRIYEERSTLVCASRESNRGSSEFKTIVSPPQGEKITIQKLKKKEKIENLEKNLKGRMKETVIIQSNPSFRGKDRRKTTNV